MSVELLASTVAVSGIRFAVTRLVSEELGLGRGRGVSAAMSRAALYALFFGALVHARASRISPKARASSG